LCQFIKFHLGLPRPLRELPGRLVIVPITHPGSSSSLSWPFCISASSSSSLPSASSDHAISLELCPIATSISLNVVSGSLVFNPAYSVVYVSSCSCLIGTSPSWIRFLAPAVSCST
jgi:hypothetical protein